MLKRNELIGYSMEFASFLVSKVQYIDRIILYGSIAKNEFDEESDIDIFVDAQKKLEGKIKKILEEFYKTENYKKWKLKGLDNEISLIVGNIDDKEWKDLKRAIITSGLILYGRFISDIEKKNSYTLFSFENISPESRRVSMFRKLFGFKVGKKEYKGYINELKGKRFGKGVIIVPLENSQRLKDLLKKKKIGFRIIDFWTDTNI